MFSALVVDRRRAQRLRSAAMASVDDLLSEDEVAARTGLTGPLVSALIPAASATVDAAGINHPQAKRYDEVGLLRAEVAKLLLDMGASRHWVRAAVRESRTCHQLRGTIEKLRCMRSR